MTFRLGIRWTMGDVSARGYQALRLSLWGAHRVFGAETELVVCVNTVSLDLVRHRVGNVPPTVRWRDTTSEIPGVLRARLDAGMAEGVAWKLVPLRVFPDRWELSLDNDCILWSMPSALEAWLEQDVACLLAADVVSMFGQFAAQCGPEPRNAGIRGLPPGFDLDARLARLFDRHPTVLSTELDEQGLQVAALSEPAPPFVIPVHDVSICSPFPPHQPELGRCGAHFVGVNTKRSPWDRDGRRGDEWLAAHWDMYLPQLCELVGVEHSTLTAA